MRSNKPFLYLLNDEDPVSTDDVLAWCDWFEKVDRTVDRTEIGDVYILTTFTGMDPSWSGDDQPVLWETTIFGGPHLSAWAENLGLSGEGLAYRLEHWAKERALTQKPRSGKHK